MTKLRSGSRGDSNPDSLDCESTILALNHPGMLLLGVTSYFNYGKSFGTVLIMSRRPLVVK